jgi:hypothetical protein
VNTTVVDQNRQQSGTKKIFTTIAAVVGGLVLLAIIAVAAMLIRMNYVPADLDYATTRLSEQGLYEISYRSDVGSVPVNQMQSWTLHVETAEGEVVENATITVDGDMPQHGHGLPTRPQVTSYLGQGDYRVEGLKFHMPGWWVMDFVVNAEGQTDQVRFNLLLQ